MRILDKNDKAINVQFDKEAHDSLEYMRYRQRQMKRLRACRRCSNQFRLIRGLIHFDAGYCSEKCFIYKKL